MGFGCPSFNTLFCCTEDVEYIFTKSVVACMCLTTYTQKVATSTCIFHNTYSCVSSSNALFSSIQVLNLEPPILEYKAHNIQKQVVSDNDEFVHDTHIQNGVCKRTFCSVAPEHSGSVVSLT